jgi:dihydrofolate synthase/folylpolyglutamate synthase
MNYRQTLDYLYSRLPMFTRTGTAALKKDLVNTIAFCAYLGNPQGLFRSVHIAGTNGKGSTSHMLAAILQVAGYKTGLYTSPHLKDFRERIRINGAMISKKEVGMFVKRCRQIIDNIEPSFFEATVAMAFEHFAKHQVDIAVIEVGLGGRLDSTNVITPLLSVITNISYDHTNILGNTLPAIAAEKSGIIKRGIPVVIGEKQEGTGHIFIEKAGKEQAPLFFASEEQANAELISRLRPDLTGAYQEKNIRTVLCAVSRLREQGFNISDRHIIDALGSVKQLTGLSGRWQTIGTQPLIICDTGHNEAGIREVLKSIHAVDYDRLHLVIGMLKDKDHSSILRLLPKEASYYFCQPGVERALSANALKEEAADYGLNGKSYATVKRALSAAKKNANGNDLIFVGGSTFVVAEVL